MGLFKKNPVFCILCAVGVLAFVGGTALVVMESGKLATSKRQVESADSQIKGLLYATPAPTSENVQAAQKNAEELNAKLQSMRDDLQRGSRLTVSSDGTRVMAGLQRYMSSHRRRVANHKNSDGVKAEIVVPNGFAFGFEKYASETKISDDAAIIPQLDKQRQILRYILDQLIKSDPAGIQVVEREVLEQSATADGGFKINPAISARVPGAIDTLAFRVTFTGYTPSLRKFLNKLAEFELPLVVRSVEVDRPTVSAAGAKKKGKKAASNIDDIFSVFGGASSSADKPAETKSAANKTPVISDTESSFTVTLEFIEIILPSNSEENSN
ncbi:MULTISPECIES: Amuc_1100 family pilus-like protein [unclassified Lentimonas]|uniref:Amuc_1100 family pilus-like protein n=1 Tax=unclassified Lentimonas TaxID=2630993 RepID=UPI001329472C|nr:MULTISPECIES: Amuc_1100 family pilus-like protein [unclassified Lentimonas]CAA6679989.1 Unannotated [Lentimonas sp. CC4]CAA6686545.1 Unannotated [Lentimonas sp. CC6]CAA6690411.1 Unannotated [Lentimonas sp. CC19]CAA6693896.1 Unannotated [Lentimonas sp. CC10]CAA7068615.1 Unannotated [Lentimonas sp. CC11]